MVSVRPARSRTVPALSDKLPVIVVSDERVTITVNNVNSAFTVGKAKVVFWIVRGLSVWAGELISVVNDMAVSNRIPAIEVLAISRILK